MHLKLLILSDDADLYKDFADEEPDFGLVWTDEEHKNHEKNKKGSQRHTTNYRTVQACVLNDIITHC